MAKRSKKKNNIGCFIIIIIVFALLLGTNTTTEEPTQSIVSQTTVPKTDILVQTEKTSVVSANFTVEPSQAPTVSPSPKPTKQPTQKPVPELTFIYNKNTKKFHYEWCSSVEDIKEKNKGIFTGTSEQMENKGYQPCKRCKP